MHNCHISCRRHLHHHLRHSVHLCLLSLCVARFSDGCWWRTLMFSTWGRRTARWGTGILYDKSFHIKLSAQETAVHRGASVEPLWRPSAGNHLIWSYLHSAAKAQPSVCADCTPTQIIIFEVCVCIVVDMPCYYMVQSQQGPKQYGQSTVLGVYAQSEVI